MPYKSIDKQREYQRNRVRQKRLVERGATQGITPNLPPDDELFAGLPDALQLYANGEQGGTQYRQLIHHLKTTPIEQLQAEGRPFIPCWRYAMEPTA